VDTDGGGSPVGPSRGDPGRRRPRLADPLVARGTRGGRTPSSCDRWRESHRVPIGAAGRSAIGARA
jgi:hypothetical protein